MQPDDLKVIQEIKISASHEQVWAFLLNEQKMKQWLNANEFVIDVYEGGSIEIPLVFDGKECLVEGEIGLVVPQKKFAFTWLERDEFGETWFNNTMVTLLLDEDGVETKLTLIHDGFKYLPLEIRTAVYHKYLAFWGESNRINRMQSLIMGR